MALVVVFTIGFISYGYIIFGTWYTAWWKKIEYNAYDYELAISADKAVVSLDEAITITATVKNTSGKDLWVQLPWVGANKLEQMILFDGQAVISLGGHKKKVKVKKSSTIQATTNITIEQLRSMAVEEVDGAYSYRFYFGTLKSEPIKININ